MDVICWCLNGITPVVAPSSPVSICYFDYCLPGFGLTPLSGLPCARKLRLIWVVLVSWLIQCSWSLKMKSKEFAPLTFHFFVIAIRAFDFLMTSPPPHSCIYMAFVVWPWWALSSIFFQMLRFWFYFFNSDVASTTWRAGLFAFCTPNPVVLDMIAHGHHCPLVHQQLLSIAMLLFWSNRITRYIPRLIL